MCSPSGCLVSPLHCTSMQGRQCPCNRKKGAGSQAELIAKLKRDGIISA